MLTNPCANNKMTNEEMENLQNSHLMEATTAVTVVAHHKRANKSKRVWTRKLHKFIKMLTLKSKSKNAANNNSSTIVARYPGTEPNTYISVESEQNRLNESCEYKNSGGSGARVKGSAPPGACVECDQNSRNENKQNWKSQQYEKSSSEQFCFESSKFPSQKPSVCYVFMPGQNEPVEVKLRSNHLAGGVLYVSYSPDVDFKSNLLYQSGFQKAEAQRPILVA